MSRRDPPEQKTIFCTTGGVPHAQRAGSSNSGKPSNPAAFIKKARASGLSEVAAHRLRRDLLALPARSRNARTIEAMVSRARPENFVTISVHKDASAAEWASAIASGIAEHKAILAAARVRAQADHAREHRARA